jgi:glycosyltransferase 2 family protein
MARILSGTTAKILLGLVVSAACLAVAFASVPVDELTSAIGRAGYGWLLVAVAGQVVALLVRAVRWRLLLLGRAGFSELFWAQAIGFLVTNVFPLRAGEAARVLVVAQRTGLPLVQVATSVVLERALDVATILALLVLLLPLMQVPTAVLAGAGVLTAALVAGFACITTLVLLGDRGRWILAAVAGRLPKRIGPWVMERWQELEVGLAALRSFRAVVEITGWSILTWASSIVMVWAVIEAIAPGASWIEPAFMIVALAIGVSVPSSPGFIGVFQLIGQQALLTPFGYRYSAGEALAIAVLTHLVYYVVTSAFGTVGLARLGLSLKRVRTSVTPA